MGGLGRCLGLDAATETSSFFWVPLPFAIRGLDPSVWSLAGSKMTQDSVKSSRQSAHLERRRAALIASAQDTIAKRGHEATIEELATSAGVSIATLYKHFGSKEGLLAAAIVDVQQRWEAWMAEAVADLPTETEQFVAAARLGVRGHEFQPEFARIGLSVLRTTPIDLDVLTVDLGARVERLAADGVIRIDQIERRTRLFLACLVDEFIRQGSLPKPKPDEADAVVEVALSLVGFTPARARKLVEAPLSPLGGPSQ